MRPRAGPWPLVAAALGGALVTLAVVHFGEAPPARPSGISAPAPAPDEESVPATEVPPPSSHPSESGAARDAATETPATTAAPAPSAENRRSRPAESPQVPFGTGANPRIATPGGASSSTAAAERRRASARDPATRSPSTGTPPLPAPEMLRDVSEVVSQAVGYATVEIRAPAGSLVEVDGISHGQAPFSDPIRIPEGSHLIRVTKGRGVYDTRLSARAGEEYTLDVEFISTP